MAFEEYVQSEIVEECAKGFLTRREALRRLMLLGVGAAAAGVMLAGCSDEDSSGAGDTTTTTGPSSTTTTAGAAAAPVGPAPLATEAVTFAGPAGQLKGSWSAAAQPRPRLLQRDQPSTVRRHGGGRRPRQAARLVRALPVMKASP